MSNLRLMPLILIIFAVLARLVPHPLNFAPITALALFGGVYLPRKYAFIIPFGALLISDFFIGFYGLQMYAVYLSFGLISLVGLWLKNHKKVFNVVFSSIFSSVLFYLITNLVFLYSNSLYPKTFEGQIQSYIAALPFFRGTLFGDLFYTGVFFGGFEFLKALSKKYLSVKLLKILF